MDALLARTLLMSAARSARIGAGELSQPLALSPDLRRPVARVPIQRFDPVRRREHLPPVGFIEVTRHDRRDCRDSGNTESADESARRTAAR